MPLTRRHLLTHGAMLATMGALPRPLFASFGGRHPEPLPPIEDPRLKEITSASLSAATAAGASYADVRLTHLFEKNVKRRPDEGETMSCGVRVLVDGYWGFAASPLWSSDEAARLARTAVAQAKANSIGQLRRVDLAPVGPIVNGHWTMPIKHDPFAITRDEISDLLDGLVLYVRHGPYAERGATVDLGSVWASFLKREQAFASTENQYYTQRTYLTYGSVGGSVKKDGRSLGYALDCLSPAGVGYELFRDQPLRELIEQSIVETLANLSLPVTPVDVGRYETVFDAKSMATALSKTIGFATQLDRALGYEANAGGTSYIVEPLDMLGTFKLGSPAITISGNRSEVGGANTVKWDDDGATPTDFTLVKEGYLADMQTNREGAGWLQDYYKKTGQPIKSHGCAYASEGMFAPLTHNANLTLHPATDQATFESLIGEVEKGLAFQDVGLHMDFQQISGLGRGRAAYEVRKGKRVAMIANAGILFRTPELWNSVKRLGGVDSQRRFGALASKGEPAQSSWHSVTAVPATVKDVTIIDPARKA